MRSQITIGKKLILAFTASLVLTLGISYSSLLAINKLGSALDVSINKASRKLDLIWNMRASVTEMRFAARGILLSASLKDNEDLEKSRRTFKKKTADLRDYLSEVRPMLVTGRDRGAADKLEANLNSWIPLAEKMDKLSISGQLAEADGLRKTDQRRIGNAMDAAAADLLESQRGLLAKARTDGLDAIFTSRWTAFVMIGLSIAVGIAVAVVVRQISSALGQLAAEMADGADQVSAAASQVSSSSQSLAQGSSEQAASIQQTSASSEEIHSMTRKNAENSRVAADSMVEASTRIGEANRNLEQMVVSMNEINASSDKISKIIKVIDEIAFQTNILALNAAVEAARAGEAGMGFAVVADEVRNLAQRCAQAAKDTAGLIEESITKSNDGKTKLDHVAVAVRSITDSATKVKTLVDEVKLGSEEQARGIEQMSKAIAQMEKVTQTTAANAEESASASQELSAQSDTLRTIVARLNSMVGDGANFFGRPLMAPGRSAIARKPHLASHTAVSDNRSQLAAIKSSQKFS